VRLAASQQVIDQLAGRINTRNAIANAEAVSEVYEMLRAKGIGSQAAMQHAERMIQGDEPMATPSIRFASVYGNPSGHTA
jgi:hypothetical protein